MIVEMRTTRVKSQTQKKAEERFAQGLAERTKLSPLGGYFHTDVGHIDNMSSSGPTKIWRSAKTCRSARQRWAGGRTRPN